MRRLVLAIALLVAGAPSAHADPMEITGHPCRYGPSVVTADGEWTAVVYGGPQKLSHVAGSPLVAGSLRCTLQVDGNRHSDPDAAFAEGPVTPEVAVVPPTPVTFHVDADDEISVCAQVDVPGEGTYYWNDYANDGNWSTDPASTCTSTILLYVVPPYLERVYNIVGHAFDPVGEVDPTVCPRLAALAPGGGPVTIDAEGDVAVAGVPFWDCPPYE